MSANRNSERWQRRHRLLAATIQALAAAGREPSLLKVMVVASCVDNELTDLAAVKERAFSAWPAEQQLNSVRGCVNCGTYGVAAQDGVLKVEKLPLADGRPAREPILARELCRWLPLDNPDRLLAYHELHFGLWTGPKNAPAQALLRMGDPGYATRRFGGPMPQDQLQAILAVLRQRRAVTLGQSHRPG